MKIYSVAWGWTPIPEDMPEGDSLMRIADEVAALGFDGIDYLSTFESFRRLLSRPGAAGRSVSTAPGWGSASGALSFRAAAGTIPILR